MADLEGVRALVTGGTSGLGRAMARALVDAGARVALTSRELERAQATASQLGDRALGLRLDVRDAASVTAGVDQAFAWLGSVDLLVSNAGIGMVPDELDDEARSRLLDPAIMGPPIVWLASAEAGGVHDERIVATEFEEWLARR